MLKIKRTYRIMNGEVFLKNKGRKGERLLLKIFKK